MTDVSAGPRSSTWAKFYTHRFHGAAAHALFSPRDDMRTGMSCRPAPPGAPSTGFQRLKNISPKSSLFLDTISLIISWGASSLVPGRHGGCACGCTGLLSTSVCGSLYTGMPRGCVSTIYGLYMTVYCCIWDVCAVYGSAWVYMDCIRTIYGPHGASRLVYGLYGLCMRCVWLYMAVYECMDCIWTVYGYICVLYAYISSAKRALPWRGFVRPST